MYLFTDGDDSRVSIAIIHICDYYVCLSAR